MALNLLPQASVEAAESTPHAFELASDIVLATWDVHAAGRCLAYIGEHPAPPPVGSVLLPKGDGTFRRVLVTRWLRSARIGKPLSIRDGSGREVLRISGDADLAAFGPKTLLAGLDVSGRIRLAHHILEFTRTAFGLQDDALFAESCRSLAMALTRRVQHADIQVALTNELLLGHCRLPDALGRPRGGVVLGRGWIRPLGYAPAVTGPGRDGSAPVCFALRRGLISDDPFVVLFMEDGLACRGLRSRRAQLPGISEWLERNPHAPLGVREYAADCLIQEKASTEAAAALREMQLVAPLPRRAAANLTKPVAADVSLAVSSGTSSVFLSGWLHDPVGLVHGVTVVSATGRRVGLSLPLCCFPRDDVEARLRKSRQLVAGSRCGFIAFARDVPGADATLQYRVEVALKSGAILHLVAPLQPRILSDARAAVLGSVPGQYVTPELIAQSLAPAVAPLHKSYMDGARLADVVGFGNPVEQPESSVIVPLYRNLDFIRFQIASFATDPSFRSAELIYVLDSPEQRLQVEHMLLGLHGLYGLPLKLAVMAGNFGYAAANNRGAALARGERLVLLNSDVVPDAPGWLELLAAPLKREPAIGMTGAKLLFDDGSLQHAGMYFGRDLSGAWLNQHFFKGYPRDFAPACVARRVPAVTGACMMVPRTVFERVGGFTEDYVIGDYEDSDLCLKVRSLGFEIHYVPAAELYHFERRSISQHSGYMRTVAGLYNRWLHGGRWNTAMEALMADAQGWTPAAAEARR